MAEEWADEHGELADLINRISYAGGGAAQPTLRTAAATLQASVRHHNADEFKDAHRQLQITAQHIGTAANLGAVGKTDPYYGYSMSPKELADGHARSYKYGYLS